MKTYSKIGLAIAVTLFGSTAHAALTSGVNGPETVLPGTVQFRMAQADLDCIANLTCAQEDGDNVSSDEGGSGGGDESGQD